MTKFMNSSIIDFECSAQFGNGSSEMSLSINLVDCGVDSGDSFSPEPIGTPVLFQYDSYEHFGILDRYAKSSSSSAYPQYTVHLSNGLFLLQGVKLILNDYYGVTNTVPNLINVFGYLENAGGFGASEVNDAGISWTKVASAVTAIANTVGGTSYGGTIQHKSFKYGIDLTNLPAIPAYYRINSDSISLLEFIQEVCEAGGHDFFIKLQQTGVSGLSGVFKVFVISRLDEPTPGAVQSYIDSSNCVTQKEVGQELRKDSTSKFVVGAPVERMWFVEEVADSGALIAGGITESEYATFNILPYFGNDTDGNYIVGRTLETQPDEYYFDIDIRDIGHTDLGSEYTTCFGELRAAKKGRESWERYLSERACNKYLILPDSECGGTVTARPFVIPVPSGSKMNTGGLTLSNPIMSPTGDYADTFNIAGSNYVLGAIIKYGAMFSYHKHLAKPKATPVGFDPATYYCPADSTDRVIESFTYAGCEVNSAGGISYADPTQLLWNLYYPSSNELNPYFLRAFYIGCVSAWVIPFARMFESDLYRLASDLTIPSSHKAFFTQAYNNFKASIGNDQLSQAIGGYFNSAVSNRFEYVTNNLQEKSNKLYRKIKDLADNYYGKRYITTIPSTYGAIEPESNKLRISQVPSDAGYLDSSVWDDAYADGLIPEISGINILLTPEERFYPFVKIDDAVILTSGGEVYSVPYNYSEIGVSDRYLGNSKTHTYNTIGSTGQIINNTGLSLDLWVKCSVSEKVLYRDNSTLLGPRAIVEIPGSITYDPFGNYGSVQALYQTITTYAQGSGGAFGRDTAVTDDTIRRVVNGAGIDENTLSDGSTPVVPDIFAVPLRSNVLCYGPWYLAGSNGPVEYEKNDDLAPWNYGGYSALDTAGFARVTDGVTNQTFDETGSVTVAGAPLLSVGDSLISGGPYITDLSVSTGSDGVTSQYSFQSWSSQRRLSKLTNFNTERIKRLSQSSRDLRRSYREGVGLGIWKNPAQFYNDIRGRFTDLEDLPRRDKGTTSHKIIAGEVHGGNANVVMQPSYNMGAQINDNYNNKAFMSLDGLFRPYSNWAHDEMSSLTMPEDTGEINTSFDLYPLRMGHDITILTGNSGENQPSDGASGLNTEIEIDETGIPKYRGIALKGPVVIQGWGRDIDGNPVPLQVDEDGEAVLDDAGNKQFSTDYLYNSKSWKTGPLDARWDESRGVWAAAGSTKVYLSKITNTYNPASYSYEVDRSNSRSQYTRSAPESLIAYTGQLNIYDPEYLAYIANPTNTGVYEVLNYTGIDFPHYEAFIIRETVDPVGSDYYNIWTDDCQDCGHISNPCASGYGANGMSSVGKKILIENPLRQSFDAGDLAFTIDTGRRKNVNTGNFTGGSGVYASGHITTNIGGYASFVVDAPGSGYTEGGFAIIQSGNICASVTLTFDDGELISGLISPTGGYAKSQTYNTLIYPMNATVQTERLPIHWVTQAEFKTQQVTTHVECDGGILQTCSVKIQTQGQKSCEFCGTSDSLLNSF